MRDRRKELTRSAKIYIHSSKYAPRKIRHKVDNFIKHRKKNANPKDGRKHVVKALKGFWKGLKKL